MNRQPKLMSLVELPCGAHMLIETKQRICLQTLLSSESIVIISIIYESKYAGMFKFPKGEPSRKDSSFNFTFVQHSICQFYFFLRSST